MMALLTSTGLQHEQHCDAFLNFVSVVLEKIPNVAVLEQHDLRNGFYYAFGGLLRTIDSGNSDQRLMNLLHETTSHFRELLATELKVTIPLDPTADSFASHLTPADHHFLRAVSERHIKIESAFAKQLSDSKTIDLVKFAEVAASEAFNETHEINVKQVSLAAERFAQAQRENDLKSVKKYRGLFESLSMDNGPWSTPEVVQEKHYKLENSIFRGFLRLRMKRNLEYDNHKDASIARDVGSPEGAKEMYRQLLAKMKLQAFKGDFALLNFPEEDVKDNETINVTDFRLQCDAQLITPQDVVNGRLSLTKAELIFDSPNRILRIPLTSIVKVFFRRYLLVDSALEIFVQSCKSYFVNFNGDERRVFLAKLNVQKLPHLKFCQKKPEDIRKLVQKATLKWQQGRHSNLDYLLKLNLLSGRSYHDLSQPIGAINPERFELMRERMNESVSEDTRYLYGSLYSSAAVVIGYLIRLEPFASLHIRLQAGRFDHPGRLFSSIPETWNSVNVIGMDFRELIPEFFTLPEFLTNDNGFDLGKLSDGTTIDHVLLPKWAKSPRHFIEVNRQALESKFVSANLHYWIDLIFGPTSRAPLFEQANNVFHPYFYETSLTPEVKADPKTLAMIQEYSACFGAIPGQLFDESPPTRDPGIDVFQVSPTFSKLASFERPLLRLKVEKSTLMAVDDRCQFGTYQNLAEMTKGRLFLPAPADVLLNVRPIVALSGKTAIGCFPWHSSFHVFPMKNGVCPPVIHCPSHKRPITSMAISGRHFVTASRDCTVRLWELDGHALRTIGYLTRHRQPVLFVQINERFNESVSISRDGFVVSMSLKDGQYLREVSLPMSDPSDLLVTDRGFVCVAFNGPDSHVIHVLDHNLVAVTKKTFDGCEQGWTSIERSGVEYLLIGLKTKRILGVQIPYLDKIAMDVETPFTPSLMASGRQDSNCYVATADGGLMSFSIPRV
jgi:hypothetical protein